MTQVGDLLRLQQTDSEIAATDARLADIERRLEQSPELEAARARHEEAAAKRARWEGRQRQLETALEDLAARIAPDEKRLYGGAVKNPKELGAIQQEIQHLKERRAALEDELLEVLEEAERAVPEEEEARRELEERERRREGEVEALRKERESLAASLAALNARREELRGTLDAAALARYDSLLKRKGGVAVVAIRGSTCDGCRVALPEAYRRRAATGAGIIQCPNCERILATGG